MALPQHIQAQLDAADALLAQTNNPEPQNPEASEVVAPEPAPEPSPQPVAAPVAAPPPPPVENWEQRYKTLQGLFNKEVPTLRADNQRLQQQLQDIITRLDKAQEQAKPAEPQQPAVDPKDVEAFGEDLVGMVERVVSRQINMIRAAVEAQFGSLTTKVGDMERVLTGTSQSVAMTAEEKFFDRLTKAVPKWEQQNEDPAFLAWLAEVDPIAGVPRQQALVEAQQTWNSTRAIAIFEAFAPQTAASVVEPPKPDPLEKQLTPRASATVAPAAPAEKPFVTQKEIVQFYDDLAKGKYRGREQQAAALENRINAAIQEGRVR